MQSDGKTARTETTLDSLASVRVSRERLFEISSPAKLMPIAPLTFFLPAKFSRAAGMFFCLSLSSLIVVVIIVVVVVVVVEMLDSYSFPLRYAR